MNAAKTLSDSCPEATTIQAFVHGQLDPTQHQSVADHLNQCGSCASIVEKILSDPNTTNCGKASTAEQAAPTLHALSPLGPVDDSAVEGSTIAFLPAHKPVFLGPYRIAERIGQGGMGSVFRAEHDKLKKWFAIKILPETQGSNPHAVGRFHREMQVVGRLNHPNIVRATDAGESGGRHYLVMELIDGVDLAKLVREAGPLPIPVACEIIRQAADGLQHAFEHELVHRDLKPHNLMLSSTGDVKILDLGLAFFLNACPVAEGLTWNGQVMGTPPYMAPEQWKDSHTVDIRADLYSLGCTLYYLITGRPPIDSSDHHVLLREVPKPLLEVKPDLPPDEAAAVDELLGRLLAKDPDLRPQTPADLACELTPLAADADLVELRETSFRLTNLALTNTPVPSPIATRKQTTRKTKVVPRDESFRRRLLSGLAVALLVGVTFAWAMGVKLSTGFGGARGEEPPPPPPPAGPMVGKWFNLLDRTADNAPRAFYWENAAQRSHKSFDADAKQVFVQVLNTAMISLGVADKPNYFLKLTFRQAPWTGYVGVFYGGKSGSKPGELVCEAIELCPGPNGIVNEPRLRRVKHSLDTTPNRWGAHPEVEFATADLERLELRDYTIEVRVRGNSVAEVLWDGVLKKNLRLTHEVPGLKVSCDGEFGFYVQNGSATLLSAELLLTE